MRKSIYIFLKKKKKKNQHDKDGFLVMKTDECLIPLALLSDMLLSIRLIIFIFAALLLWCRYAVIYTIDNLHLCSTAPLMSTEKEKLSCWQLDCHWMLWRLSNWQPSKHPVTIKLSAWQFFLFSASDIDNFTMCAWPTDGREYWFDLGLTIAVTSRQCHGILKHQQLDCLFNRLFS